MFTPTTVACSWSGGKDSCYALIKAMESGAIPKVLLSIMNEEGKISRSHALPATILLQQAAAMGIPLITVASSWSAYETLFIKALKNMVSQYNIQSMVFGDIDLDEHRAWEEKVCLSAGITALLPLWKRERKSLVMEMLDFGIQTMIVSCNTKLGESFLGRMMDAALITELEAKNIDVCGEGGEFHTVVINCPFFHQPLQIPAYQKVRHEDYHFLQFID